MDAFVELSGGRMPYKRARISDSIVYPCYSVISGGSLAAARNTLHRYGCVVIERAFDRTTFDEMLRAADWAAGHAMQWGAGGQISPQASDLRSRFRGRQLDCMVDHDPVAVAVDTARACLSAGVQRALCDICFGKDFDYRLVSSPHAQLHSSKHAPHAPLLPSQKGVGEYQAYAMVEDSRKLCFVPSGGVAVAARSGCDASWGTIVILRRDTVRFESEVWPIYRHEELHRTKPGSGTGRHFRIDVAVSRDTLCAYDSRVIEWLRDVHHLAPSPWATPRHTRKSGQDAHYIAGVVRDVSIQSTKRRR